MPRRDKLLPLAIITILLTGVIVRLALSRGAASSPPADSSDTSTPWRSTTTAFPMDESESSSPTSSYIEGTPTVDLFSLPNRFSIPPGPPPTNVPFEIDDAYPTDVDAWPPTPTPRDPGAHANGQAFTVTDRPPPRSLARMVTGASTILIGHVANGKVVIDSALKGEGIALQSELAVDNSSPSPIRWPEGAELILLLDEEPGESGYLSAYGLCGALLTAGDRVTCGDAERTTLRFSDGLGRDAFIEAVDEEAKNAWPPPPTVTAAPEADYWSDMIVDGPNFTPMEEIHRSPFLARVTVTEMLGPTFNTVNGDAPDLDYTTYELSGSPFIALTDEEVDKLSPEQIDKIYDDWENAGGLLSPFDIERFAVLRVDQVYKGDDRTQYIVVRLPGGTLRARSGPQRGKVFKSSGRGGDELSLDDHAIVGTFPMGYWPYEPPSYPNAQRCIDKAAELAAGGAVARCDAMGPAHVIRGYTARSRNRIATPYHVSAMETEVAIAVATERAQARP